MSHTIISLTSFFVLCRLSCRRWELKWLEWEEMQSIILDRFIILTKSHFFVLNCCQIVLTGYIYSCKFVLFLGACWAREAISWAYWFTGMWWNIQIFFCIIDILVNESSDLLCMHPFFQYHKQTQLESMASEKGALEFQLEKSLKQFHEVQVPNFPSSISSNTIMVLRSILILLPFCHQCVSFDR